MSLYRESKRREEFGGRYKRIKPSPNFKKASYKKRIEESPISLKTQEGVKQVKKGSAKVKKGYKTVSEGYKKFKKDPMVKDFWSNIGQSLTLKEKKEKPKPKIKKKKSKKVYVIKNDQIYLLDIEDKDKEQYASKKEGK